jgi:hypothetical protein
MINILYFKGAVMAEKLVFFKLNEDGSKTEITNAQAYNIRDEFRKGLSKEDQDKFDQSLLDQEALAENEDPAQPSSHPHHDDFIYWWDRFLSECKLAYDHVQV